MLPGDVLAHAGRLYCYVTGKGARGNPPYFRLCEIQPRPDPSLRVLCEIPLELQLNSSLEFDGDYCYFWTQEEVDPWWRWTSGAIHRRSLWRYRLPSR